MKRLLYFILTFITSAGFGLFLMATALAIFGFDKFSNTKDLLICLVGLFFNMILFYIFSQKFFNYRKPEPPKNDNR